MLQQISQEFASYAQNFQTLFVIINAILHLLFAGAVARDASALQQTAGQKPALVSATTWAFATLLGGVVTAAIYWFIHHSNLTRATRRDNYHERS